MISNSKIFTTSVFGNSSSLTSEELAAKNTKTVQEYYGQYQLLKMNSVLPNVPSNQGIAKDK
jgi:hypothetical protein